MTSVISRDVCPSYVMDLVRVNQDAVLQAADQAATASGERAVVVLVDGRDDRARVLAEHHAMEGLIPREMLLDDDKIRGFTLVSRIGAARMLAGPNTKDFDEAARIAEATRAMLVVVCCLGGTYVGCLPRAGAVRARA